LVNYNENSDVYDFFCFFVKHKTDLTKQ